MTGPARHRLILIAFCAVIWLPGLPARTLWPTDEPRYALIARDMAQSGDYVVPMKRGEVYHSQPPLYLWAQVVSARLLGGMSEAAARLPSFLAATGGVLVTHGLAAGLFGPAAGMAAALVLATDLRYLIQAQWASTDMMLCFFVTATLAAFYAAYDGGRRSFHLIMYAMAGLGVMTKGPVGAVLPGMVIVAFLAARRDLREVLRMRLHWGVLIVAAIVAPWALLFWRQAGPDELVNLVLKQSFQRYTDAWNNLAPWYYFLWRFPLDFLPWFVAFPFAVAASWRGMEARHRTFLWTWILLVFLFFSASSGKRGVYILPLHPAAALIVGWYWDRAPARLRAIGWGIAALLAALGVAIAFAPAAIPGSRGVAVAIGVLSIAAGAAVALAGGRRRLAAIAASVGVITVAGVALAAPIENRRQNVEAFAAEIARRVPPSGRLGVVRDRFEDLVYYSGRDAEVQLRPGKRVKRWLEQPGPVYAVLDQAAYDSLLRAALPGWEQIDERILAGDRYYLIVKP